MSKSVHLDAAACDGVGICAVVAAGLISLDAWGFPEVSEPPGRAASKTLQRAARACPHRALHVHHEREKDV